MNHQITHRTLAQPFVVIALLVSTFVNTLFGFAIAPARRSREEGSAAICQLLTMRILLETLT